MPESVKDIDPTIASELIQGDTAILIDVRENDEWTAGHASGAVHVPLAELDPGAYSGEQQLVVVCRSGGRSSKAATTLAAAGLSVHNVAGGMKAWQDAGHSVIREDESPGTVI